MGEVEIMFNPIRVFDKTFGHNTGMVTSCFKSFINNQVFNLSYLFFAVVGDPFTPHFYSPADPTIPIPVHPTFIAKGSIRVFIKNIPVGLAGPTYKLSCLDYVIPDPTSRVFIGM